MKLLCAALLSFLNKRYGKLVLVVGISMFSAPASFGQNLTSTVNSYLKEQVKETAVKGTILVAENMTDWFSQPEPKPVVEKPLPKKKTKPVIVPCQAVVPAKSFRAAKVTKRI